MHPERSRAVPPEIGMHVYEVVARERQRVRDEIKRDVLELHVLPGERIDAASVMRATGAARSVVHRALRELADEGLLTGVTVDGAVVAAITAEEAAEVNDVRRDLEAVAIRRFVQRASPAQLSALEQALLDYERALDNFADTNTLVRLRDRFYGVLLRASGSVTTIELLITLHTRIVLVTATGLSDPAAAQTLGAELRDIYEGLARRDPAPAIEASSRHIDHSTTTGIRRLANH